MPNELIHLHDANLEATMLWSVISWPEHLTEDWSYLPDEVFYLESHRKVWKEIRHQHTREGTLDLPTLAAAFVERQDFDTFHEAMLKILGVNGGGYDPTAMYAPTYAKRLKRLYVQREKARAVRKYETQVADDPDDGDARIELEMLLHVLDGMLDDERERDDTDLARDMGPEGRYTTGFDAVDRITGGFARPGLNIIAARPSVGKTSLARTIIRKAAQRGDHVFWYSKDQAENQILELEMARALRRPSESIRQLPYERRLEGIQHVRNDVWKGNVNLVDRPLPLPQLLTIAKVDQPDLIVIDYVQIIDTGIEDEYESITAASKALKTLALQLRVPIIALAQFNRAHVHQAGKPPSMSNLRGSGQLEQDADQIYALERDTTLNASEPQEAKLHVLKNKVGGTGVATLTWVGRYADYQPASRPHEAERLEGAA